jgi:hypothetical protein
MVNNFTTIDTSKQLKGRGRKLNVWRVEWRAADRAPMGAAAVGLGGATLAGDGGCFSGEEEMNVRWRAPNQVAMAAARRLASGRDGTNYMVTPTDARRGEE